MAELSEVMKKKKAMCDSYILCKDCPANCGLPLGCIGLIQKNPDGFERIVNEWAGEHPIKTNKDKLYEVVAKVFDKDVARYLIKHMADCDGFKCPGDLCEDCKYNGFWENEYKEQTK